MSSFKKYGIDMVNYRKIKDNSLILLIFDKKVVGNILHKRKFEVYLFSNVSEINKTITNQLIS